MGTAGREHSRQQRRVQSRSQRSGCSCPLPFSIAEHDTLAAVGKVGNAVTPRLPPFAETATKTKSWKGQVDESHCKFVDRPPGWCNRAGVLGRCRCAGIPVLRRKRGG